MHEVVGVVLILLGLNQLGGIARMKLPILKTVFVSVLSCAFCLLAMGCYRAPLPDKREPISSRKLDDFDFVKVKRPSRSEVEMKLGAPDAFFPDLRVSAYPVNTVIRHKLTLAFFIIPVRRFRDYDLYDVALIEFDECDITRRYGVVDASETDSDMLEYEAKLWLRTRDEANSGQPPD